MPGDPGEVIRAHLKKAKQLKLTVHKRIGKAYDTEETESLAAKAKSSQSPHMYPSSRTKQTGLGFDLMEKETRRASPEFCGTSRLLCLGTTPGD